MDHSIPKLERFVCLWDWDYQSRKILRKLFFVDMLILEYGPKVNFLGIKFYIFQNLFEILRKMNKYLEYKHIDEFFYVEWGVSKSISPLSVSIFIRFFFIFIQIHIHTANDGTVSVLLFLPDVKKK